jgi:hypothetical protein
MGLFSIFWECACRKRSFLFLLPGLPQLEVPERGSDRLRRIVPTFEILIAGWVR